MNIQLTEEQIKENLVCYEQAMRTGMREGLQFSNNYGRTWNPIEESNKYSFRCYRRIPKTTPTSTPWEPKDIPSVGVWFKHKDMNDIYSILGIRNNFIATTWGELDLSTLEDYLWSPDKGTTWLKCDKESLTALAKDKV